MAKNDIFPVGEFRYFVTIHEFIDSGYIKDVTEDTVQIVFHKKFLDYPTSELPRSCLRRTLRKSSIIAVFTEKAEADEELKSIQELNALTDDLNYGH